jgi:hypothetical protein
MLEKLSIKSSPINGAKLYKWNLNSTKYFKKYHNELHAGVNAKTLTTNRKKTQNKQSFKGFFPTSLFRIS